jgi:hypothetical protein
MRFVVVEERVGMGGGWRSSGAGGFWDGFIFVSLAKTLLLNRLTKTESGVKQVLEMMKTRCDTD